MTKKRKKTELGRTLAKIRIDFDETGADMAKKIDISSSQMFNIEVGLAQVGYEFIGKIKEVYGVDLADLMRRGGFMSKITLDLDELSAEDKDTVLEIWSRKWEGEPKELVQPSVPAPPEATETIEKPSKAKTGDTTKDRKARGRPRTMRARDADVGFLDEEGELEGIDEASAL